MQASRSARQHRRLIARSSQLSLIAAVLMLGSCTADTTTAPVRTNGQTVKMARSPSNYVLQPIAFDGAKGTVAQGINAAGDVVGYYWTNANVYHGFIWRDGEFTTVDYPGAIGTDVRGIGPGGVILGNYWNAGESGPASHGFTMSRQGEFSALTYPGHLYMIAQRILPDGAIVGCRHDMNTTTTMRGIVIADGTYDEIAAYASMHNGATPDLSLIVGLYTNTTAGRTEGYRLQGGVMTPFMIPGSTMTAAWDVNASGAIAGVFMSAGVRHGFVLNGEEFVAVDFPGATDTRAFGINSRGDIVGQYTLGGVIRGFVGRAGGKPVE